MNLRTVVLVLGLLAVLSSAAGGYLYYHFVRESALKDAEIELVATNEALRDDVARIVSFNQDEVRALAGFEQLQGALVDHQNEDALLRANRVLDNFAKGFAYDVCFLIDSLGNTIASSNRNQPDSFVGHSYHFRKYFQDAIEGRPSVELALGTVTGRRGIFVSYPVYPPDDARPIGVVVIKVSTRDLDRLFSRTRNMDTLLVNNDGIIFASNRENWILNHLWKLSPEELERILETKQFGKGPWSWTGLEKKAENLVLDSSGADYAIREMDIENCPGWRIVSLFSYKTLSGKILDPWAGKTGYIALILCLMVGGAVTVLYVIAQRDIECREKSEEELRQSEERYRSLVEDSFDGIFIQQGPKIVFANSCLYEMLGYSPGELEGIDHWLIFHRDSQDLLRRRAIARMRGEEVISQYEVMLQRKDGSSFPADISARLVQVDGKPGIQVWLRDISGRRRAEEAQKRLSIAVEQAAEAIVITDPSGTIQYINPAFESITGYSRDEAIGENTRILRSGQHDEAFFRKLWETLTNGQVWTGQLVNRKKDGTLYRADVTISPVCDSSGEIINYVAVTRDVTREFELRGQLLQAQKMEAIGTLAAGVAHDFNNLLQVITGYSELFLTKANEQDPFYSYLERINQAGQKGADLVRRLLTFGRKSEYRPCPLNLNYQIEQLQKMLERTIPKMIKIELKLDDRLSPVNADPNHMDQVLMNLAMNARDAMPDGGVLTIETSNVFLNEEFARVHIGAKPGAYVIMSISDTGHGMDKETLGRIYEPFYTTKEVGKGTGLGLAMVYGVVTQHDGQVRCYSEPGHGTTFRIYLPALVAEKDQLETAKHEAMPKGGTETILLVDDGELLRDLGKTMLEESGYKVLTAAGGTEALDLYRREKERISLVILDLVMPEMGGKQCLEELLKIDPKVRVLIASGFVADSQITQALEMGARGSLDKPYKMKEMLQAVREVLD